jgi:hypothetical protein
MALCHYFLPLKENGHEALPFLQRAYHRIVYILVLGAENVQGIGRYKGIFIE